MWAEELKEDVDSEFLLKGIAKGFDIVSLENDSKVEPVMCSNYKSATSPPLRDAVDCQIKKEIELGRYVRCSDKPTVISALGAIPKDSGKVRLIHDCSRPSGKAENDYSLPPKFSFDTVDGAVKSMVNGYEWLAKLDISEAYRAVPISDASCKLTGLQWCLDGVETFLMDVRLPFGSREGPSIFHRLSQSIVRMAARRGYRIRAYLDDFLIIADSKEECEAAFQFLKNLITSLGFAINESKSVAPCQMLTYLGIEINSIERTLSLPNDKLQQLVALLGKWRKRVRCTKRQLQTLVGKLQWAAQVIREGRTHVRHLIALLKKLSKPNHHVRISSSARRDIGFWADCCSQFNGTAYFIEDKPVPLQMLSTDACMEASAGFYAGDYFYTTWEVDFPGIQPRSIFFKEMFTLLLAAERWAHLWRNQKIVFLCDNMSCVACVNSGKSSDPDTVDCLQRLFWLSVINNCEFKAEHLSTKENYLADAISRAHDKAFYVKAGKLLNTWGHDWSDCMYPFSHHMSYIYHSNSFVGAHVAAQCGWSD